MRAPWRATFVKKRRALAVLAVATAFALAGGVFVIRMAADDDDHRFSRFQFQPDSLVLSKTVYVGTASTVTIGETLPPGCAGGANGTYNVDVPTTTAGQTTSVAVNCGVASDNGEFPNTKDTHNVWNNAVTDATFGVTSPIFLE